MIETVGMSVFLSRRRIGGLWAVEAQPVADLPAVAGEAGSHQDRRRGVRAGLDQRERGATGASGGDAVGDQRPVDTLPPEFWQYAAAPQPAHAIVTQGVSAGAGAPAGQV